MSEGVSPAAVGALPALRQQLHNHLWLPSAWTREAAQGILVHE